MEVIALLAWGVFHWPVAGHGGAAGADQGIKIHVGSASETILGEKCTTDFDANFVGAFFEDDCGPCGVGEAQQEQGGSEKGSDVHVYRI
jgi:hypothetical protein